VTVAAQPSAVIKPPAKHSALGVVRRLVIGLALSVFGLLLAWLLIELGARLFFNYLPSGLQGDIQNVQRWPWDDSPAGTLIPKFPFIGDRDFQERLPVGLLNYYAHWGDSIFTFNTISAWDGHRAGLRSDPPVYPLDIIAFGDSFTFCWTVWTECWVKQIADRTHWHVFDAGIPGTGSTGELALMRELVPPMKPKLILWTWYNNDVTDNYDLARIRNETPPLATAIFPPPVADFTGLARYSVVVAWLKGVVDRAKPGNAKIPALYQTIKVNGRDLNIHTTNAPYPSALIYPNNQYGAGRDIQAHVDAEAFAAQNNAKMVIILIPTKEEVYADLIGATLPPAYIAQIGEPAQNLKAACQANGWLCIDPLPELKAAVDQGQTVYWKYDAHLDPVGNQILSDVVEKAIKAQGLLN